MSIAIGAVLVCLLLPVSAAGAITNGLETGPVHGYTAALLVGSGPRPDGTVGPVEADSEVVTEWLQVCSGVLITAERVATAGHCAAGISVEYGVRTVGVSFAADLGVHGSFDVLVGSRLEATASSTRPLVGTLAAWDRYQEAGAPDGDLGLVRLAAPVLDVEPLPLADVGYLDGLRRRGRLRTATFLTVGYGSSFSPSADDVVVPGWTPTRKVGGGAYRALAPTTLTIRRTRSFNYSGPCFGDSGGPVVHRVKGREVLVGIISTGEGTCQGWTAAARVDDPYARHFLLLL
jgi:hypothetical protein